MTFAFYTAAAIAVLGALLVVLGRNALHAALYLIVSLLGTALALFTLGAAFAAMLEVIVYAGAIVVMILFAILLLDLGRGPAIERASLGPRALSGPCLLGLVLLVELVLLLEADDAVPDLQAVSAAEVGRSLFGPYLLGVELGGFLLLAGMIGALHLSRRREGAP